MPKNTILKLTPILAAFFVSGIANAQYSQTNLISDGAVSAAHTDAHLVNPWGLAFSPTGPFWISDNGGAVSTVNDGTGAPFPSSSPLVVNIQPIGNAAPTGIVFYGGKAFLISGFGKQASALFMFASEDGFIQGWNPSIAPGDAIIAVDNHAAGAVYKGLARGTVVVQNATQDRLFATNFRSGFVEVYDGSFNFLGQFTDPSVDKGFAPFGIENVNNQLVVTFAKQDAEKHDDVAGPGNGFVDIFTPSGRLVERFASHGVLDSPWGIAVAPSSFGKLGGRLLIGNFGDGRINAFNIGTKAFVGSVNTPTGAPIINSGLWGLRFGNGGSGGDKNKLYFTAGLDHESRGLFGSIQLPSTP